MAKSQWFVQSNYWLGKGFRYIASRILDTSQVVHSGNMEHSGEYSENREEVQKTVDELNQKEERNEK